MIPVALLFVLAGCGSVDYTEARQDFAEGDFSSALSIIRSAYDDAGDKDKLLFLMEAGVVYHTQGDYLHSEQVFTQAADIADTAKESLTGDVGSFIISDNTMNFVGESYERVLIRYYLGVDRLLLQDPDGARKQFKKLNYDLKEMGIAESSYRQNLMARYLDAILAEKMGEFNDARVQYKNIEMMGHAGSVLSDRYVLALNSEDGEDRRRYAAGVRDVVALDKDGNRVPYKKGMAQVVILNQGGLAAHKESRGKISASDIFKNSLESALKSSLSTSAARGLSLAAIMTGFLVAENPIPIYKKPTDRGEQPVILMVNGQNKGPSIIRNDYSATAMQDFEERYPKIVARNVTAIAVKAVAAAIAAKASSDAMKKQIERNKKALGGDIGATLAGFLVEGGTAVGAGIAVSVLTKPDLRSWSLLPSNFQSRRVFLEPGDYELALQPQDGGQASPTVPVHAEKGDMIVLNFRTINRASLLSEPTVIR